MSKEEMRDMLEEFLLTQDEANRRPADNRMLTAPVDAEVFP